MCPSVYVYQFIVLGLPSFLLLPYCSWLDIVLSEMAYLCLRNCECHICFTVLGGPWDVRTVSTNPCQLHQALPDKSCCCQKQTPDSVKTYCFKIDLLKSKYVQYFHKPLQFCSQYQMSQILPCWHYHYRRCLIFQCYLFSSWRSLSAIQVSWKINSINIDCLLVIMVVEQSTLGHLTEMEEARKSIQQWWYLTYFWCKVTFCEYGIVRQIVVRS